MQAPDRKSPPPRWIARTVRGVPVTDGAGVPLARVIGQPALPMLDPFLLLDVIHSDRPGDYRFGFPEHPHRGFETVTYLLAGRMRHKDSAGHEGVVEAGGVQWMTAGRGIVHSEMPEQAEGLLHGFQLWVNLPAAHKMDPPRYQEYPPDAVPEEQRDGGVRVRVVAGITSLGSVGPVEQPLTDPIFLDVHMPAYARFAELLPSAHNAFVYVVEGEIRAADGQGNRTRLQGGCFGTLAGAGAVLLSGGTTAARFLLVAGRPLREPVARAGPFVMNTRAELLQAYTDFQQGRL